MRFVGIDVDKWKCRAAIMDEEDVLIDEFTFTNNPQGIDGLTSRLDVDDRAVMESTGSVWMNQTFRRWGLLVHHERCSSLGW